MKLVPEMRFQFYYFIQIVEFSIRKKWNYCWIVDPVDGTKEFVNCNGEFTVNIALIKNGKPVLGVIYVPAIKVLLLFLFGLIFLLFTNLVFLLNAD